MAVTHFSREFKSTADGTTSAMGRDPKSMAWGPKSVAREPESMAGDPESMAGGSESMARGSNFMARGTKSMANIWTISSELEVPKIRKKCRRGVNRKGKRNVSLTLSVLGNNVNGLHNKIDSLLNNISYFKPSIITLQD